MNFSSVTSIVPKMIIGIFLILAWFPSIIFNELNNKGNINELNDLINNNDKYIKNLEEITLTDEILPTKADLNLLISHEAIIDKLSLNTNYYLTWNETTSTKDSNNTDVIQVTPNESYKPPSAALDMKLNNYKYLLKDTTKVPLNLRIDNGTVTYSNYVLNSIPTNSDIVKVTYSADFQTTDVTYYDYEFGKNDAATKSNIINLLVERKKTGNFLSRWGLRILIFIMLALGLGLIVAPLQAVADVSGQVPYLGGLLSFPVKIILSLYYSLGIASALLLTVILTFLVWGLINYPIIAGISAGGLFGLIYMSKRK